MKRFLKDPEQYDTYVILFLGANRIQVSGDKAVGRAVAESILLASLAEQNF